MHSYVIRTEASLSEYKDVLKDLVHPAGKKVLGDYFVYRTGFGPSADFVGFRSEELASPFFANYLPYTIATVSDGAFNASNNGQFGVLDSSIDLRGVCSGFIGSGSYPDLYYDYFPYGYDGATGYTLEFPSNQEDNLTPRTSFGTGLSLGSDNQDLNKFGGIGATQEFFARLGKWPRKVQEVQYFNRLSAQNRDQHELAPFERGDIVTQLDENGNNRLFGVVYENSWSQNFGRFKVLISNTSNRNFRAASPSEQEIAFQTSSSLHKVQNVTKGSVYTGGSDFKQELKKIDINNDEYKSSYGNTVFRTLSFLYSRMMAVKIKSDYEEEKKFKYDCVILARFDISRRGLKHIQTHYVSRMNFDPKLDMDFVYSAYWDQLNHGYADHWFYSCSENIDTVANLYYDVFEYYQSNSDYVKSVTEGWPESNAEHEFSNEYMKPKKYKAKKLIFWEKSSCIDNHKLYKWHFMKTGLHQKSKFVDITTDTDKPRIMN